MEYLMTYGWAILVVMVVGVAMWQLGMFNMGGSIPPASSGFAVMKPILSTCESGRGNGGGFRCGFFNNAGEQIRVVDANGTIDGRTCNDLVISSPSNSALRVLPSVSKYCTGGDCEPGTKLRIDRDSQFSYSFNACSAADPNNDGMVDAGDYSMWYNCNGQPLSCCPECDMNGDGRIDFSDYNVWFGCLGVTGLCSGTNDKGSAHDVQISVTYEVDVGGVTSKKTDNGIVHIVTT